MEMYPLTFQPIYKEKIWGGRNLQRLFGRKLPEGLNIGESWELADLPQGVSAVANGPLRGTNLTALTEQAGEALLGAARPMPDGRFPLLLKLLDANDTLSLQVHPDREAVAAIGGDAALKTECWYYVESRDGYIYRGVKDGVTPAQFRKAIETDTVENVVVRETPATGDFHFLPAGTVHALGAGLVVAEVQTPSDTTYRVTDWGRGREIHVERSMQCIHFTPADDAAPGASGETLLVTEFFNVAKRAVEGGVTRMLAPNLCSALMLLEGEGVEIRHAGSIEPVVSVSAGDTVLLPASLRGPNLRASKDAAWLEVTLPAG